MFSVEVTRQDATTVVELSGDVDYATRDATNAAVAEALGAPSMELVMDLRAVGFIDSVGVEAAIAAPARAASTLGVAFRVESSPAVHRILGQMGLNDLLRGPRRAGLGTLMPSPRSSCRLED